VDDDICWTTNRVTVQCWRETAVLNFVIIFLAASGLRVSVRLLQRATCSRGGHHSDNFLNILVRVIFLVKLGLRNHSGN
jgi:hypothetical protein